MAFLTPGKNFLRRTTMRHPLIHAVQGIRHRKLEVILTTSIDKLGKAGETVKVAPGYFRNHLMPKLLALPNIEKFKYLVHEQRRIYQPKEDVQAKVELKTESSSMKEHEAAANRLSNTRLNIRKFIVEGKGIELRDPVTKEEIVAEVGRQFGVKIEPENLFMPEPLSSLGEYKVRLRLPKSIPKPAGMEWILNVKIRK
ncbi:hypothetical protein M569_01071, partial [Genlisea aurea]